MKLTGKILIVDDEPINLEFFDLMLSKLGFRIRKAIDGEDALVQVREFEPDLILLDNIMPKLSGWEVTKILKQDREYRKYRDVPIIMFSAMDSVKDKIEGYELGVDDYITKPFNFSEVLARIRAVLRHRELAVQITRRERRIGLIESLNRSLIFFTQHVRTPITSLTEAAEKVDVSRPEDVRDLVESIRARGLEILASLEGLQEEIRDLQEKGDKIKRGDLSVVELERRLARHLAALKDRTEKPNEVEEDDHRREEEDP